MQRDKLGNLKLQNIINAYISYCAICRDRISTVSADIQWRYAFDQAHQMLESVVILHVTKQYKLKEKQFEKILVHLNCSYMIWSNIFKSYGMESKKYKKPEHTKKARLTYQTAHRLLNQIEKELLNYKQGINKNR